MAMKAKEFLEQVEKYDTMIENKRIEMMQWHAIATSTTAHSDDVRVQTSGNPHKMENAADRAMEIQREINVLINKMINSKLEIIETIEKLNATEYDVLHKIYIQRKTLDDVADVKHKTYSWVTTVHGRALQNVQRILDERKRNAKDI